MAHEQTCTGTGTTSIGALTAKRPPPTGQAVDYEIVNMSDPYLMTCADERIAQVACLILGEGAYGLKDPSGNTVLPILLFGAGDRWIKAEFGSTTGFGEFLKNNEDAVADALATVRMPAGHKRSSLNNIGARASAMAEMLRDVARERAAKEQSK